MCSPPRYEIRPLALHSAGTGVVLESGEGDVAFMLVGMREQETLADICQTRNQRCWPFFNPPRFPPSFGCASLFLQLSRRHQVYYLHSHCNVKLWIQIVHISGRRGDRSMRNVNTGSRLDCNMNTASKLDSSFTWQHKPVCKYREYPWLFILVATQTCLQIQIVHFTLYSNGNVHLSANLPCRHQDY